MPFHTVLKELVDKVPSAVGAILVDWEGESVQEYCHGDPYNIRFIAAHKGIVLSRLRETNSEELGGEIEDVVVTSRDQILLIGAVDKDYSLVLQAKRTCPVGLARYHFNNTLASLKKEI